MEEHQSLCCVFVCAVSLFFLKHALILHSLQNQKSENRNERETRQDCASYTLHQCILILFTKEYHSIPLDIGFRSRNANRTGIMLTRTLSDLHALETRSKMVPTPLLSTRYHESIGRLALNVKHKRQEPRPASQACERMWDATSA